MKKFLVLSILLTLVGNIAVAKNYQSEKYYKLTERNSRGQKVSTTRVYYRGDRTNVTKVEQYSTSGRQTRQWR